MDANEEYYCFNWLSKEVKDTETFSHDNDFLDRYFEEFLDQVSCVVKQAEEKLLMQANEILAICNA